MSTSMEECRSGCGCGSPLDEDTGRCVECGADSRPSVVRPIDDSVWWHCPGCDMPHRIDNQWSFNGDMKRPTISPSVLTRWATPEQEHVCHCFIRDGRIEFLSDCTHPLAGQTVDMVCPVCSGTGVTYGIEGEGETVMSCEACCRPREEPTDD